MNDTSCSEGPCSHTIRGHGHLLPAKLVSFTDSGQSGTRANVGLNPHATAIHMTQPDQRWLGGAVACCAGCTAQVLPHVLPLMPWLHATGLATSPTP